MADVEENRAGAVAAGGAGTARALDELRVVLGDAAVLTSVEDRAHYLDPFSLRSPEYELVAGAVQPTTVEEIRSILKVANEHHLSLWTVSQGRNLGYGGGAPRVPGSLVVDLSLMKRIIEIDDELCYAIVEPGVTFFDLYEHIQARGLKLWPSSPALGWGSVVGNTLDRGWGYTPLGDHSNQQCGMEVVLANGDLLRTGMGAIDGSRAWPLFRGGYGPSADALFMQSNFGIVTKLGIWIYPQPEAFMACGIDVESEEDLPLLVDLLSRLRRKEIVQNNPVIGNVVRFAGIYGPRARWYDGEGPMPEEVLEHVRAELGIGKWNARFALYGDPEMIDRRFRLVEEAFEAVPGARVTGRKYVANSDQGLSPLEVDEIDHGGQVGYPSLLAYDSVAFRGEDGAHIGFSPVLPPDGKEVYDFYLEGKAISARHGFDFFAGFHTYARHLTHINMILFDRASPEQRLSAGALFEDLVVAARRRGYAEYRAHLDFMDLVAEQYDFNDHALLRFNETIKDALDPNGILSPGKQGIWPRAMRAPR